MMSEDTLLELGYKPINIEYVYLTIPAEWICVYHKILVYMADFGETMINDCTAICQKQGKNILSCWNLFQSALACRDLGRNKEADFFIKYIKKQLNIIYKGTDEIVYDRTAPISITEDGKLKALVTCKDHIKFYVDPETGLLYQNEYIPKIEQEYGIEENNLVTYNNE